MVRLPASILSHRYSDVGQVPWGHKGVHGVFFRPMGKSQKEGDVKAK